MKHFKYDALPNCVIIGKGCTVEPLLYDHPQNHIGVVV